MWQILVKGSGWTGRYEKHLRWSSACWAKPSTAVLCSWSYCQAAGVWGPHMFHQIPSQVLLASTDRHQCAFLISWLQNWRMLSQRLVWEEHSKWIVEFMFKSAMVGYSAGHMGFGDKHLVLWAIGIPSESVTGIPKPFFLPDLLVCLVANAMEFREESHTTGVHLNCLLCACVCLFCCCGDRTAWNSFPLTRNSFLYLVTGVLSFLVCSQLCMCGHASRWDSFQGA